MIYYYKDVLDYAIVEILNEKYPLRLRYKELEQGINLYLESKISPSTLYRHLEELVFRWVIYKKQLRKHGPSYYSLTKKFKNALDIKKKHFPNTYAQETLSLSSFSEFHYPPDYFKPLIKVNETLPENKNI